MPPYVEIRFKALSPTAARQLRGNGNVTKKTWADPTQPIYRNVILPGHAAIRSPRPARQRRQPVNSVSDPRMLSRRRMRQDGFALALTLIVLSLLVIIAVGFLASASLERQTASGIAK